MLDIQHPWTPRRSRSGSFQELFQTPRNRQTIADIPTVSASESVDVTWDGRDMTGWEDVWPPKRGAAHPRDKLEPVFFANSHGRYLQLVYTLKLAHVPCVVNEATEPADQEQVELTMGGYRSRSHSPRQASIPEVTGSSAIPSAMNSAFWFRASSASLMLPAMFSEPRWRIHNETSSMGLEAPSDWCRASVLLGFGAGLRHEDGFRGYGQCSIRSTTRNLAQR